MSNTTNNKDILNFKFLSSKEFIKELQEKNFPPDEHNLLLSAHLLSIGFNTSGINEGGMNFTYYQNIAPIKEDFTRARSEFYFMTTRNGLIEERNFNRQSMTFNNPMFRFSDTRAFRDFCVEYFNKYSKNSVLFDLGSTMSTEDKNRNKIQFKLRGRKRASEEGQLYGYESIVCGNPIVKALLESWYLDKELPINCENKTKKIKL